MNRSEYVFTLATQLAAARVLHTSSREIAEKLYWESVEIVDKAITKYEKEKGIE